jgi:NAD(P)H dehydrogenase (quinone)
MNNKILVTGATGQLGQAAVNFLLQKGVSANSISALARSESKADNLRNRGVDIRIGDYDNYDSLVKAFEGIDTLLFVSGSDVANRKRQHQSVVEAAKQANVRRIIYTSYLRKNEPKASPIAFVAESHVATEEFIKESGINYTILKNGLYADVLPMFWGPTVLETGIVLPTGGGRAAYTTREDMAEAAAIIAISEVKNKTEYTLAAPENLSMQYAADILSEVTGKKVAYIDPGVEGYRQMLAGAGVPAENIEGVVTFAEAIAQEEFAADKTDLEDILGRKATSLKDYLQTVFTQA